MISVINSLGLIGIDSILVRVEVDIFKGMPSFDIIGLPDASIKESRDRVRSSIKNCGYEFPVNKIIVNLAPADVKKYGPIYELPMFIALLQSSGQISINVDESVFVGELSLNGDIRPINGALSMTIKSSEMGFKRIFLPYQNAAEASVVEGIDVYGFEHIEDLILFLIGSKKVEPVKYVDNEDSLSNTTVHLDFSDVKGQSAAVRALEISAAGGHNVLLIGPPGSGKSMLAKRMGSILPDMTFKESIETTKVYSIAGLLPNEISLIRNRPFRSPHHTISPVGLSGGGSNPKPGEISLAHNGLLFLDELPEFSRSSMEVLRQPLEDNTITISRVSGTLTYPSDIILIAAMNPCPCGYFRHPIRHCTCSTTRVSRYLSKISGPLLDRLDLHIDAMPVEFDDLVSEKKSEPSASIKLRVNHARNIQNNRYEDYDVNCNAKLTPDLMKKFCNTTDKTKTLLKNAFSRLSLSARSYDKILRVARTIADLENCEIIDSSHVAEAIQYRSLDRKYWSSI